MFTNLPVDGADKLVLRHAKGKLDQRDCTPEHGGDQGRRDCPDTGCGHRVQHLDYSPAANPTAGRSMVRRSRATVLRLALRAARIY